VTACIRDALKSPISGVNLSFDFVNMGVGTGKLDGITGAGVVPDATDESGCVTTSVNTTGISGGAGGTGAPGLTFSLGEATATAPIVAAGDLVLIANPSAFVNGGGGKVTLTLLSGNGTPVPGVQIVGSCTGDPSIAITIPPGVTNAAGQTTANIVADLNKIKTPGSGTCTFKTSTGTPTVDVRLSGTDLCTGVSPAPPACGTTAATPVTLSANLASANTSSSASAASKGYGSVSASPSGVSCAMAGGGTTASCTGTFNSGTVVTLTATPLGSATTGVIWGGACAAAGSQLVATVTLDGPKTCTAKFSP